MSLPRRKPLSISSSMRPPTASAIADHRRIDRHQQHTHTKGLDSLVESHEPFGSLIPVLRFATGSRFIASLLPIARARESAKF
jgi:hypothetical protein